MAQGAIHFINICDQHHHAFSGSELEYLNRPT